MQDKVVAIGPHIQLPDEKPQPVPEIVALLRQSLAEAERGELRGCAMIGVTASGNFMMRWHASCNAGALLAASVMLHETIKNVFIENAMSFCVNEPTPPAA